MIPSFRRCYGMQFLNDQIARMAKSKKQSLIRKQISCGIFQETSIQKGNTPNPEKANDLNRE